MTDNAIQPRIFENTTDWHRIITRQWGARPTVDLHGSIDPPVVEAGITPTGARTARPA